MQVRNICDPRVGCLVVYLTIADIAAELRISKRSAYDLMKAMSHLRAGRLIRVSRAAFERWKRDHTLEPQPTPRSRLDEVAALFGKVAREARQRGKAGDLSEKEPIHVSRPPRKRRSC